MVIIVVGIARVVVQRAHGTWRDPLLEFFNLQLDLVFDFFFHTFMG